MPQPVLSSISTFKRVQVPTGFFLGIAGSLVVVLSAHMGLVYWQLGVPTQSSVWAHEINQKKLERAASIEKPKLLVVGGSGALFGIQAELMEAKLEYPTVNLGTHAALGVAYMTHMAQQAAKPGDTVLLAFEYGIYRFGRVRRDLLYIDYLFARDPGYFRALPLPSKFQVAMSVTLERLRIGIRNWFRPERPQAPIGLYDSAKLNAHGDQLGNEAAKRPAKPERLYVPDPALVNGFRERPPAFAPIEDFVAWARANDVRVLATFPGIMIHPAYHTKVARESFSRIREGYEQLQVPIIGALEESMMEPSAFYDTCYHLTREGARVRTERLIPHLRAALNRERK